ncbi:hypothetical protein [Pendulispora albinea]|uniref:Lipoprotein n=1 Tax=Pendulispora albinea TaxID=2741071 RepID=A0ABZ2M024_9BACT
MNLRMVSFASFTLILASAALAGCSQGSSPSPETAESSSQGLTTPDADTSVRPPQLDPETRAKLHAKILDHARCMREHGVDWPDPPEPKPGLPTFFTRADTASAPPGAPGAPATPATPAIPPIPAMPVIPGAPAPDGAGARPEAVLFRASGDAGIHIALRLSDPRLPDGGTSTEAAAFEACASKFAGTFQVTRTIEAD